MSFSLCLIGNSHLAAIKQAWTNHKPAVANDVSVAFFSASVRSLEKLELEAGVLVARDDELIEKLRYTSEGQEQIDLRRYDAFAIFGMGFSLDVPNACGDWDIVTSSRRAPEGTLLSRVAFAATIEADLESGYAPEFVDIIRSVSDKPIMLCAAPFWSERVLLEDPELAGQDRFRDSEYLAFAVAAAKEAGEKIAARHRCEVLWQMDCTVGRPGFTKLEFADNPARFTMRGKPPPVTDRRHGNEAYGVLMLNAALQRLNAATGGRVLPLEPKPRAAR